MAAGRRRDALVVRGSRVVERLLMSAVFIWRSKAFRLLGVVPRAYSRLLCCFQVSLEVLPLYVPG